MSGRKKITQNRKAKDSNGIFNLLLQKIYDKTKKENRVASSPHTASFVVLCS